MRSSYVAVLDIRSSELTAMVGERGVNNTFIIKSKYNCAYDGYAEGELLDKQNFILSVREVVKSVIASASGVKKFYVSVPGEFLRLSTVDKVLGFSSSKRIGVADCRALTEMCRTADDAEWKTIRHSFLYYVLSDKRKIIDPVGTVNDSLQGKCCFFKCRRSFCNIVNEAFSVFKDITEVNLIPINYAEAMYLIEPEVRDECAVLLDLGYISSTYSVICGNGLLYSESFSVGIGHIAFLLMTELDIPFDVASAFLSTVNLNAKEKSSGNEECMYEGKLYSFPSSVLRKLIREGLDGLCETIEECRQNFTGKNIDGKSLLITGEGVKTVRGAVEHLAGRLVKGVEIIAPKVPYYDKPHFSSALSLLDTALRDSNI